MVQWGTEGWGSEGKGSLPAHPLLWSQHGDGSGGMIWARLGEMAVQESEMVPSTRASRRPRHGLEERWRAWWRRRLQCSRTLIWCEAQTLCLQMDNWKCPWRRGAGGKTSSCSYKNGGEPIDKRVDQIRSCSPLPPHPPHTHKQTFLSHKRTIYFFSSPTICGFSWISLCSSTLLSPCSPCCFAPHPPIRPTFVLYYSIIYFYPMKSVILIGKSVLIWLSNDIILWLFKASHLTSLNLNSHICETDEYLHISQPCWVKQL